VEYAPHHPATAPCVHEQTLQDEPGGYKAQVFSQRCGKQLQVVKHYANAPAFFRHTICKILLEREQRALRLLQGIPGVPKYYGNYGEHGFRMEAIAGRHPRRADFRCSEELRDQLRELIEKIHRRGITHNDLRMRNLLIDGKGCLYLIDYAAVLSRQGKWLNWLGLKPLFHMLLAITDRSKVLRLQSQDQLSVRELSDLKRAHQLQTLTRLWKQLRH
jgi:hypothetical protein